MGENESLGWFPRYIGGQPMCNDVGCATTVPTIEYVGLDTSGNPIYKPNTSRTSCGTILKSDLTDSQCFASAKAVMDAMAEKYKPIADKLMQEVFESSQKPIELLSEETAQQINKAFENIRINMKKDFPMAFAKRKARKHYKPKFTL